MIEGMIVDDTDGSTEDPLDNLNKLRGDIGKTFFSFAIPGIWTASSQFPFVVDSGYPCTADDILGTFMSSAIMTTRTCINGKLYYLASLYGPAATCYTCGTGTGTTMGCGTCENHKFVSPPGVGALDGTKFGGTTAANIVNG